MLLIDCINHLQTEEGRDLIYAGSDQITTEWRISYYIAIRYMVAAYFTWCEYKEYPTIFSGYRSPERQQELINKWDAGEREGLLVRPSESSWHMQHLAIDVRPIEGAAWMYFVNLMRYFGCTWGGEKDRVHFSYPRGERKTIDQLLYAER